MILSALKCPIPKRAHTKLTAKRKLREKKARYDIKYLSSLSQVIREQQLLIILIALIDNQFLIRFKFMRRFNKINYSNKIDVMQKEMLDNQYNEKLLDDDFFYFGISSKLGAGTKKDPVHIMMISRGQSKIYLKAGVFQIDGTYRLTKNNYPWKCVELLTSKVNFIQLHS
jgi:hypothetical protein